MKKKYRNINGKRVEFTLNEYESYDKNRDLAKLEEITMLSKSKSRQLKARRKELLANASMTIQGSTFTLNQSQLAMLQGRIDKLENNTDTLGWNDDSGNRIQLNRTAFESLLRHIQTHDISVWDLYSEKLDELNAIVKSKNLAALEAFDTNF